VIEIGGAGGEDGAGGPREVEVSTQPLLPDGLPVLPLRENVPFPETLTPLAVGQERSIRLVNEALGGSRMLTMVASRQPELDEPSPDQLYDVGVAGTIARMLRAPDGTLRLLVQGAQRVRITRWVRQDPYLFAEIEELPDVVEETPELAALVHNVQRTFSEIVEQVPYLPEELQLAVANVEDPSGLSHLIAGALRLKTEEKQELLEEVDVAKRLRRLSEILARELEVISLGTKIHSQVQSELDKSQREYFLRQQLKAIQEELGEVDEVQAEVDELREQLDAIELPEEVRRQADRELSRLEKLPPAAAEHGVIRSYLEWIATTTSTRSRSASWSSWPCASSTRRRADRSCASWGRPAWARRRWGNRSPGRWGASSNACRWAASATRRRSAATAARTSAPCPEPSSGRCATPGRATRCS
jgi:ATP-dependent Lon protease